MPLPTRARQSLAAIAGFFRNEGLSDTSLRLRCALLAALLIVAVFPDIVFLRASLSLANFYNFSHEAAPREVSILPEHGDPKRGKGRQVFHGKYDSGGGIFQSEPAQQFMADVLRRGESPYWNPYSATGSLGPETLVDVKFSPFSLLVAASGGRDWAFHLAYLGLCFGATFALLLLLAVEYRLSLPSALAGGIAYLLNGYHIANLGSNVAQAWLYLPPLILALTLFARRATAPRFVGVVGAICAVLATTFLPTMIPALGTALAIGIAVATGEAWASPAGRLRDVLWTTGGFALAVLLAFGALAFLYLPIAEAMIYLKTGEYYAGRNFVPVNLINLISVFTPKHAFETYTAMPLNARGLVGNDVFHQGIVAALIASQAARAWPRRLFPLVILLGALVLALTARAFGVPGIAGVIDLLPIVGHIGEQYLWMAISIAIVLLVPFGLEALLRRGVTARPLALLAALIFTALAYAAIRYGVRNGIVAWYVVLSVGFLGGTLYTLRRYARSEHAERRAFILLALAFVELTFYVNHLRLTRDNRFMEPPSYVAFLKEHLGQGRVVSYGPFGLPPEYGSAFQIPQIETMNFAIQPHYMDFFERLVQPNVAGRWPGFLSFAQQQDVDRVNLDALDFLGVRYALVQTAYAKQLAFMGGAGWNRVMDNGTVAVLENPHPFPRAFVVPMLRPAPQTPLDAGISARAVAFTEDAMLIDAAARLGIPTTGDSTRMNGEEAAITLYRHTRVRIEATLAAPGVLVLTDVWHPNWSATVDGAPAPIGRVDEAFRGIALPAGTHTVELSYRPKTLTAALWISGLSVLTLVLLCFVRRAPSPACGRG